MKLAPTAMLPKSALPYDLGHTLNHALRVMGSPILPEVRAELLTIWRNVSKQLRRYGHAIRFFPKERSRPSRWCNFGGGRGASSCSSGGDV